MLMSIIINVVFIKFSLKIGMVMVFRVKVGIFMLVVSYYIYSLCQFLNLYWIFGLIEDRIYYVVYFGSFCIFFFIFWYLFNILFFYVIIIGKFLKFRKELVFVVFKDNIFFVVGSGDEIFIIGV